MAEAHKVQIKPSAMYCPVLRNHCHTLRKHLLDLANTDIYYCRYSCGNVVFYQTAFQVMVLCMWKKVLPLSHWVLEFFTEQSKQYREVLLSLYQPILSTSDTLRDLIKTEPQNLFF